MGLGSMRFCVTPYLFLSANSGAWRWDAWKPWNKDDSQ
jgi:hypothetical protein